MKRSRFTLVILSLLSIQAFADTKCFLVKENGKTIKQEGDCQTPYAPQSTFKIPLSLMGYDAGILKDETRPVWEFKPGYDAYINVCKSSHNPREWMRDSCLWYSQVLTPKLGMKKFKDYIIKFDYGNRDVSGDPGKNNGLTHSWVSSSIKISPDEQTVFLQKLIDHKLPVSTRSYEMTKRILFREELSHGWKLYGKTGSATLHGWFIGWIEKDGRAIVFANHIVDDKPHDSFASFRARDEAKNKLWYLIDELAK
jgi:beta-lactamase class D